MNYFLSITDPKGRVIFSTEIYKLLVELNAKMDHQRAGFVLLETATAEELINYKEE